MAQPKTIRSAQLEDRRDKILKRFPKGIAEIIPITTKRDPFVEPPVPPIMRLHAAATTIPVPVFIHSGATNPQSGLPETTKRVLELIIFDRQQGKMYARTDQAGDINNYLKPIELLEYLLGWEGYGKIYHIRPVEPELLEIEKRAGKDPRVKQEVKGRKVKEPAKEEFIDLSDDASIDPFAQLDDEELQEDSGKYTERDTEEEIDRAIREEFIEA